MSSETKVLTKVLSGLGEALDATYSQGHLSVEADVQCVAASYLKKGLAREAGLWIIGCEHNLCDNVYKPDITCYRLPSAGSVGDYVKSRDEFARAVVEIKYASDLKDDLEKLEKLQKNLGRVAHCVAWMVYGDHFDEGIHAGNYRRQLEREAEIREWEARLAELRGATILRLGSPRASDSQEAREIRGRFTRAYWICD